MACLQTTGALMLLAVHLITERVAAARGALLLEALVHGRGGQTVETIAVCAVSVSTVRRGIAVGGAVIGEAVAELDVVVRVGGGTGAKHAATTLGAARVAALTRAGDDVAKLDATGLAVPEAEADDEQDDGAKDDWQGNDEGLAAGAVVGSRARVFELGDDEGVCGGNVVGIANSVVQAALQGDGDVIAVVAVEELVADLKGEVALLGGHLDVVKVGEDDPFVSGAVLLLDLDGESVRLVELAGVVFGVPGY